MVKWAVGPRGELVYQESCSSCGEVIKRADYHALRPDGTFVHWSRPTPGTVYVEEFCYMDAHGQIELVLLCSQCGGTARGGDRPQRRGFAWCHYITA